MFEGLIASFAANKVKYLIGGGLLIVALVAVGLLIHEHYKREQYIDNEITYKGQLTERTQAQSEVINAVQNSQIAVSQPSAQQLDIVCNKYDRNCPHGS